MLDAVKVLFILTGASTYLVTKYINVGIDNARNETFSDAKMIINDHHQTKTHQNIKYDDTVSDENNKNDLSIYGHNQTFRDSEEREINYYPQFAKSGDNEPPLKTIIDQPIYEIEIIEEDDTELPRRLLQVQALTIGADENYKKDIMFLLSGDGVNDDNPKESQFAINAFSGELFLISPIDCDPPKGKSKWLLNITAEDGNGQRLQGWASIRVNVRDINDNDPKFQSDVYYGNITENNLPHVPIVTISAHDADANAVIRYSIEMNRVNNEGELIFNIDPLSGLITSAVCCFDRESIDRYLIKISVTDGGHREGSKPTATVIIFVNDLNDSPVKFMKPEVEVIVEENAIFTGKELTQLRVIDNDLPQINKFAHKIVNDSNYAQYFDVITNSDGSGSAAVLISDKFKLINYYQISDNQLSNEIIIEKYYITIGVTDIGSFIDEKRIDYCELTIKVTKSNTIKSTDNVQRNQLTSEGTDPNHKQFHNFVTFDNRNENEHHSNGKINTFNNNSFINELSHYNYVLNFLYSNHILLITAIMTLCAIIIVLCLIINNKKMCINITFNRRLHSDTSNYSDIEQSRDTLGNYNYDGGGECDVTQFDLTQLRVPIICSYDTNQLSVTQINDQLPDVCTKTKINHSKNDIFVIHK